jgi:cyclic pyranopterin phosphate synthase
MEDTKNILSKGTSIFNPQAKVIANADRVVEFLETGNTSPVLVEIDPSNACNHGCYFCISSYIHLPESRHLETFDRSQMPRDMMMSLCQDLIDMDVRAINWTGGGEPTLNRHTKEAIKLIGDNSKIKMGMFTNGTLFDRWDMFDVLVDYMTWVRISIDAGGKEAYNSIRRAKDNDDWDKMASNLNTLIEVNNSKGRRLDLGVGFVITPDTYEGILGFAEYFVGLDIDYCQFKPEVVNREREGGIQRDIDFWNEKVEPLLEKAKSILGEKFQINGYKLDDLENDPSFYGRNYKKCLGSQIQPLVGADGHVYVCTNHRGYKQYSYGNLRDKSFKEIWNDLDTRRKIMHQIDDVECFANCTKLCKPHESNKILWQLSHAHSKGTLEEKENIKTDLLKQQEEVKKHLQHPEFI